jgi:O-antigen ligase
MGVAEIVSGAFFVALAFGLAVAVVLAFGVFMHAERDLGHWITPMLVPLVVLGIGLGTLLSHRTLTYASFDIESITSEGEGGGGWTLRIISFVLVGLCAAKVFGHLLRRPDRRRASSNLLFASFVCYFTAGAILNSVFGTHPAFIHNTLYSVIVFWAAYLAKDEPLTTTIDLAKAALLGLLLLSLLVAAIKPELALQPNYRGWIPGLNFRLWGLGSNPNSIGPLALLLLLLESMQPSPRRWSRWTGIVTAVTVLFLSQSKTAWIAAAAAASVLFWYRHGRAAAGTVFPGLVLLLIGVLATGTVGLAFVDIDNVWHRIALTQAGNDISTLTGRAQIWAAALDAWRANPLFGYGPTAWGNSHRFEIGLPFAFSAHNQLMQTLSTAGALGVLMLLIYLIALGIGSSRMADQTRGVSVALLVLVFIRCLTEAPLTFGTILNGDYLTHLVLYCIALRGYPIAHCTRNAGHILNRQNFPSR